MSDKINVFIVRQEILLENFGSRSVYCSDRHKYSLFLQSCVYYLSQYCVYLIWRQNLQDICFTKCCDSIIVRKNIVERLLLNKKVHVKKLCWIDDLLFRMLEWTCFQKCLILIVEQNVFVIIVGQNFFLTWASIFVWHVPESCFCTSTTNLCNVCNTILYVWCCCSVKESDSVFGQSINNLTAGVSSVHVNLKSKQQYRYHVIV